MVALPVAAWLGFDPELANNAQSYSGLKFVAVILPGIIAAPAVFMLFNYPIDEARHAEIRQSLRERGVETS